MLLTQEDLCLDSTVTGFFLISFEDDKRRGLAAAPAMTRPGLVRQLVRVLPSLSRWFILVGTFTRLFEGSLPLAVLRVSGLLVTTSLRICHTVRQGKERENTVVTTGVSPPGR